MLLMRETGEHSTLAKHETPACHLDVSAAITAPAGDDHRGASPIRKHWLDVSRLRLYPIAALACYGIFVGILFVRHKFLHDLELAPLAPDFMPFWSASYLALHGHAVDAYNVKLITEIEVMAVPYFKGVSGIMPWLYPPTLLVFILPLALLPFGPACAAFLGATLVFYVWVMRRIAPWPGAALPTVAFPGIALVLAAGQIGLLTGGLAGLSLSLLKRRPVLAGICAGLLFIKPHLALLFPLAFVCCRAWRALIACVITVLITIALSAAIFGPEIFGAFLRSADMVRTAVEAGHARFYRMPTIFAMVRMHGPASLAYALHIAVALCASAIALDAWRRPCSFALRASTLVMATFLLSPYLYDYDMAWFGLAIAWLTANGLQRGWRRGEREWLVLLWLTPLLGLFAVGPIGFQFMPLITVATLIHLWRRIGRERSEADTARTGGIGR